MSLRLRQLTEERLTELLHTLPPAPRTWVRAALELPRVQRLAPISRSRRGGVTLPAGHSRPRTHRHERDH
jgi:hypothetical protein